MYSYVDEFLRAVMWAGALLTPLILFLTWRKVPLRSLPPVLLLYIGLFSWAQAAFSEAYSARQITGYLASYRYVNVSGESVFGGDGVNSPGSEAKIPCQDPIYAHENRGNEILWFEPLAAAAFTLFYDVFRGTKHYKEILLLYLPFLLLAYLFAVSNTLPKPC